MGEYIYVDNSNVFIEGKRVSAVRNGLAANISDALRRNVVDNNYRLDFGKLHSFVAGNDPSKIRRAVLFGSRPPTIDSLWGVARKVGFETIIEDRNVANREKKIDTGITAAMMRDAYRRMNPEEDTVTLVAGDGDFVPAISTLKNDGFQVVVVFWEHASQELRQCASKFISLNPFLNLLTQ